MKKFVSMTAALLLAVGVAVPVYAHAGSDRGDIGPGRQTLPENDGWAAYSTGTTGGSQASDDHVYTAANRSELLAALGGDGAADNGVPKIIYVKGTIDLSVDDQNRPVDASFYADPQYDFQAYLQAYDPAVWGYENEVSGPLEDARVRSQKNQATRTVLHVGSNTTIVGLGSAAKIEHGTLYIGETDNIIIRNIAFEDAYDYFPQWDPTDGSTGNWNSEYDNITVKGGTHIWIDHCTFSDGSRPDSQTGTYFGREYQHHDGLVDLSNGADYITLSYNIFRDHDKTTIIGSSDSGDKKSYRDDLHLHVTIHHNLYQNVTQRLPRVRFGQVHVYNNEYEFSQASDYAFSYAWGVGYQSKIYAQNNDFTFDWDVDPGTIIKSYKGSAIHEEGSMIGGRLLHRPVDLLAAYNGENDTPLSADVGWTPTLYRHIDPTQAARVEVKLLAGAGQLIVPGK